MLDVPGPVSMLDVLGPVSMLQYYYCSVSLPCLVGCKYTSYSTFTKIFSPQTHTPLPFPLRNILPATLLPSPFFAPCSLSIKPPHFMDNPSEIPQSSIKMPLFMDNPSEIPHSSMKMPHFMDNPINFCPLSTKSPVFMDNPSEIPHQVPVVSGKRCI